jgi:hypothetical protein
MQARCTTIITAEEDAFAQGAQRADSLVSRLRRGILLSAYVPV